MLKVALFTVTQKCPPAVEKINKLYIYTLDYHMTTNVLCT